MPLRSTTGVDFEKLRLFVALGGVVAGVLLILLLTLLLPPHMAHVLLDYGQTYPLSVQNGMWIAFCIGLGELLIRYFSARREQYQTRLDYLPEDSTVVLLPSDLPDIYSTLQAAPDLKVAFLPRLIDRCILQFQASHSTDQSAMLLNTSMELFIHEVDLRYNMLRYITWVIPSLGFIGTVVGIGRALATAGDPGRAEDPALLSEITSRLAVAFDGTFLALILASVLVLLQNLIQSREEHALNAAGQYCLDHLINKLYVPR